MATGTARQVCRQIVVIAENNKQTLLTKLFRSKKQIKLL